MVFAGTEDGALGAAAAAHTAYSAVAITGRQTVEIDGYEVAHLLEGAVVDCDEACRYAHALRGDEAYSTLAVPVLAVRGADIYVLDSTAVFEYESGIAVFGDDAEVVEFVTLAVKHALEGGDRLEVGTGHIHVSFEVDYLALAEFSGEAGEFVEVFGAAYMPVKTGYRASLDYGNLYFLCVGGDAERGATLIFGRVLPYGDGDGSGVRLAVFWREEHPVGVRTGRPVTVRPDAYLLRRAFGVETEDVGPRLDGVGKLRLVVRTGAQSEECRSYGQYVFFHIHIFLYLLKSTGLLERFQLSEQPGRVVRADAAQVAVAAEVVVHCLVGIYGVAVAGLLIDVEYADFHTGR